MVKTLQRKLWTCPCGLWREWISDSTTDMFSYKCSACAVINATLFCSLAIWMRVLLLKFLIFWSYSPKLCHGQSLVNSQVWSHKKCDKFCKLKYVWHVSLWERNFLSCEYEHNFLTVLFCWHYYRSKNSTAFDRSRTEYDYRLQTIHGIYKKNSVALSPPVDYTDWGTALMAYV